MLFVHMGANDESVFALRQRHRKVIADFVCQLRCDFFQLEGLPQVIGDHIMLLLIASCHGSVLPLGKKKLLVYDSYS